MSYLALTFGDVIGEVSEFLGKGDNPTGRDLDKIKDVVNRGYRRFLYAIDQRNGRRHVWSFFLKSAQLDLVSGQWKYRLPEDFDRLMTRFRYSDNDDYAPLDLVTAGAILQKRAVTNASGYPQFAAIQPATTDKTLGTTWDVWVYETPGSSYTLTYTYLIRPEKLENDADLFLGGDFASEAILECALAAAELKYFHALGVHNTQANTLVQTLVQSDVNASADIHGLLYDPGIYRGPWLRPLPTTESGNIYPS